MSDNQQPLSEPAGTAQASTWARSVWLNVKTLIILAAGLAAFISAWLGPRTGLDKNISLAVIVVLTAMGFAMRRAPWWAWLLFVPVLLVGGCTALFMCCFKWGG